MKKLFVILIITTANVFAECKELNMFPTGEFNIPDLRIQRKNSNCWIKYGKSGKLLAGVNSEPKGDNFKVEITNAENFSKETKCLRIDATSHIKQLNKEKIVVRIYGVDAKKIIPGRDYTVQIWAKADRDNCQAKLFFEGRSKGKHYYKRKSVLLGKKWKKYSFVQKMPAGLSRILLRFDLQSPGIYYIAEPKFFLNAHDKTSQAQAKTSGNLIINGGAEQGWYCTGATTRENRATAKGLVYDWRRRPMKGECFAKWSIDTTEKHSGKSSFKGVFPSRNSHGRLNFAPVPFKVDKPALLTVWLKSDKERAQASIVLFLGSGYAYAKFITIDKKWKKYVLHIPAWGKKFPGITRHGDVVNGYASKLGVVTPQIRLVNSGTIWIDDAKYALGGGIAPEKAETFWISGALDNDKAYYFSGKAIGINLEIENALDKTRNIELSYALLDYFGNKKFQGKTEMLKLSANGIVKKQYKLKPELKGAFNIKFTALDKDSGEKNKYVFYTGIIDRPARSHPELGLDIHSVQNIRTLIPYLKDFSIGSVRVWNKYMKSENRYLGFDNVKLLKGAGLYILFCISNVTPGSPNRFLVAKDLTMWKRFLEGCTSKYKGLVDCYEILNEPNIWGARGKNPAPEKYEYMSIGTYVRVLKAASEVIKKADPNALIGGPASCHTDVTWTANVIAGGGKKYFDVITEHPYRQQPELPDYGEDIKSMRAMLKREGLNVPIFASEAGQLLTCLLPGNMISDSARKATAYSIRNQLIAYANNVKKYFHFHAKLWAQGTTWGVFLLGSPGNDGKAIPNTYMFAIRNVGDRIGGAKALGQINMGASVRCYVFEKAGKRIAVLWKCQEEDRASTITMSIPDSYFKAYDFMGNTMNLKKNKGKIELPLRSSPMYLETQLSKEKLEPIFASADISGTGNPFRTSVAVLDRKHFVVEVKNRNNNPISGTVLLLTKGIAKNEKPGAFKNLKPGKSAKFFFEAAISITTVPQSLKVKTRIADSDSFDVQDYSLKTMLCRKTAKALKIDGDLSDWPPVTPVTLTVKNAVKQDKDLWKSNDENIKADIRTAWDDEKFYVAVTVHKPVFFQNAPVAQVMWQGDSIQIAFDALKDGRPELRIYGDDDFEYCLGLLKGENIVYRKYSSSVTHDGFQKKIGLLKGEVELAVKRMKEMTVYEIAFPAKSLSPFRLQKAKSMRWNIIVNLNNGAGRMGWLELTPGIGEYKCPGEFMDIILSD